MATYTSSSVTGPLSIRNRPEDASLYSRTLRDAFALIHQVLVRWSLNESGSGIRGVVGVAVGSFGNLDTSLQAMVRARMPDHLVIRMTPLVRTCVNLSEIKLVFDPTPREVGVYAGDTLTIWMAESLWSHIYYDHVPAVERLLPSDREALADKAQGIRSIVTCCSHIRPASSMLEQVRQATDFLTERYADLLQGDDSVAITEGRDYKFLLEGFANEHHVDLYDLL